MRDHIKFCLNDEQVKKLVEDIKEEHIEEWVKDKKIECIQ